MVWLSVKVPRVDLRAVVRENVNYVEIQTVKGVWGPALQGKISTSMHKPWV